MALPFWRNEILGNLFYSGILIGGYEMIKRCIEAIELNRKYKVKGLVSKITSGISISENGCFAIQRK